MHGPLLAARREVLRLAADLLQGESGRLSFADARFIDRRSWAGRPSGPGPTAEAAWQGAKGAAQP